MIFDSDCIPVYSQAKRVKLNKSGQMSVETKWVRKILSFPINFSSPKFHHFSYSPFHSLNVLLIFSFTFFFIYLHTPISCHEIYESSMARYLTHDNLWIFWLWITSLNQRMNQRRPNQLNEHINHFNRRSCHLLTCVKQNNKKKLNKKN